jgi:hypothetical protein
MAILGLAFAESASAAQTTSTEKLTLTGMGKALGNTNEKMDPAKASATLTVTDDAGKETVYHVYGWVGVIVAKQGDGKKCEVTGVINEKGGKKAITGKSIDVKIIVVDDESGKKKPTK